MCRRHALLNHTVDHRSPDEPPHSVANELQYFLHTGLPLFLVSVLKQGVPPFFTMVVAGHTSDSATLQASLGFARTFYNVVTVMPLMALCSYFANVVPGALGAGRSDRLPRYFWRSCVLVSLFILPSIALQLYADGILLAIGVPAVNAAGVGLYCRYMVVTAWLSLIDNHLETCFINLGFVKTATLNALVTGLGVEVGCAWLLVLHLEMGMRGCALVQIVVRVVRVALWLVMMLACGLTHKLLVPSAGSGATDRLLSRAELLVFIGQALPVYLAFIAGWFIFELQLVLLTNVPDVTPAARAAGADWINAEGTIAAIQGGWIQVARMRSLKLLGRADPGAARAFAMLLGLAFGAVALVNVPLLIPQSALALSHLMSNDEGVYDVFRQLVWILAVHAQTRIVDLTCSSLLVPMGRPRLRVAVAVFSFWVVAAPIATVGSLTDAYSTSMIPRVQLCVACTSIGQALNMLCYGTFLVRTDWAAAAQVVSARANTDRPKGEAEADYDAEQQPAGASSIDGPAAVTPIVLTAADVAPRPPSQLGDAGDGDEVNNSGIGRYLDGTECPQPHSLDNPQARCRGSPAHRTSIQ